MDLAHAGISPRHGKFDVSLAWLLENEMKPFPKPLHLSIHRTPRELGEGVPRRSDLILTLNVSDRLGTNF
jgi:hypothetical protein